MATLPGAPTLAAGISLVVDLAILTADAFLFPSQPGDPRWGIFLDGLPVVVADSVVTFDYRKESRISDYQIEEGGFESYDKVELPYTAVVRFAAGGDEPNLQDLLESIRAISGDLELYDVVTPEAVYPSANVVMQDYRRTSTNGVGLLQVDVRVEEVRVTASSQFSDTKTASGANPVGSGNVSPQPATTAQQAKIPDVQ